MLYYSLAAINMYEWKGLWYSSTVWLLSTQTQVNIKAQVKPELLCFYWCWCSVLGGLIIPADFLSTNLVIGLSITFKPGELMLRWLWGAVGKWSEHLQLKQEAMGSIPSGCCPVFFSSFSWLTNVDEMKDLWCSSTVWLLSTQI